MRAASAESELTLTDAADAGAVSLLPGPSRNRLDRSMFAANTDEPAPHGATKSGGLMSYVDSFVIPVPKKNLKPFAA